MEGAWPGAVTVTRGWGACRARPWNTDVAAGHLRMIRGSAAFLADATDVVSRLAGADVYSPALYPTSTRIWRRVGYRPAHQLLVLERRTAVPPGPASSPVRVESDPDWTALVAIDRAAFAGFWRMSREGMKEAVAATPRAAVLTAKREGAVVGYAIVGAERSGSFLQRIAVLPDHTRRGIGADLLREAILWSRRSGATGILLNVRQESAPALALYRSHGFADTGVRLEVLRRPSSRAA